MLQEVLIDFVILNIKKYIFIAGTLSTENDHSFALDGLVPIRRTNVVCTGNETSFSECSFDGADGDETCTHEKDVILACTGNSVPNLGLL